MKNKRLWVIPVVLAMAFMGCPGDVSETEEDEPEVVSAAATPAFQTQPQSAHYPINAEIAPLKVAVKAPSDNGIISLQWYSNTTASSSGGTKINGETGETYAPTLSTAAPITAYYYVVASNYNKNATVTKTRTRASSVATIRISEAEPPTIDLQPIGGTHFVGDTVTLTVSASEESGNGSLSYQWYSNTTPSSSGGTAVGTDDASYSFNATAEGISYYYVVVTNTVGTNTEEVTSDVVSISIILDNFDSMSTNVTLTVHNTVNAWPANGGTSTSTDRYQYIRGYGGMSDAEFRAGNGSPSPDMTVEDAHNVFSKDPIVWNSTTGVTSGGLGLNILRTIMYDNLDSIMDNTLRGPAGGSGGSSPPAPASWNRDHSDYFDIIKEANDNGAYVILCPWAFPLSYVTGSSFVAGTINTSTFTQLAQYFKTYLQKLADAEAPIFAVSIQNEPNLGTSYESVKWSGTNERDFIRILGPVLKDFPGYGGGKATPQVWIGPGEESGPPGSAQGNVVGDTGSTGASQYIQFVPRHFYSDMQTRYATGINAGKEVWMTEHTDTTNAGRDNSYSSMSTWNWVWHLANEIYCSTALNDESAYVFWYIKRFYGFLGDSSQGTTWSAILPRGMVMSHFSKYAADTRRVRVSASGSFFSNAGTNAGSGSSGLTGTTLPVTSSNLNPTSFSSGNNDSNGQNQPTTKVMAFESMDGNSIVVIAFTPTRNSGAGGQDAGTVQINLPSGFVATNAELMRSNANVRHQMETVTLNRAGTAAKISLPRSNIVSVKFTK